jgi:hypothetical protein
VSSCVPAFLMLNALLKFVVNLRYQCVRVLMNAIVPLRVPAILFVLVLAGVFVPLLAISNVPFRVPLFEIVSVFVSLLVKESLYLTDLLISIALIYELASSLALALAIAYLLFVLAKNLSGPVLAFVPVRMTAPVSSLASSLLHLHVPVPVPVPEMRWKLMAFELLDLFWWLLFVLLYWWSTKKIVLAAHQKALEESLSDLAILPAVDSKKRLKGVPDFSTAWVD